MADHVRDHALTPGLREHAGDEGSSVSDLHKILSALPDIILLFDAAGCYREVFTGEPDLLAGPDIRGKTLHEVLPAELARTLQATIDETLRVRKQHKVEYQLEVAGGLRWFEGTIVPIKLKGQEHALGVVRDITERKRAEEQVKQLNAQLCKRTAVLETINAELESFGYSVSHDLRAPLRSIEGFSQILASEYADVLDERGLGYLNRLREASKRMARLIEDLRKLSRTTSGVMVIEPCQLSAMAHALVCELRASQPGRDVEVVIEPGLHVHADPGLLRVALENLLGNAWKYTAMKHRARIEVGTTQRDGQIAYFVRDNGAGFDMALANKLFEPFQRLHGAHEFEGTGIGLATVRRIIRRHGGEIWAEGLVHEGATFTFTLS